MDESHRTRDFITISLFHSPRLGTVRAGHGAGAGASDKWRESTGIRQISQDRYCPSFRRVGYLVLASSRFIVALKNCRIVAFPIRIPHPTGLSCHDSSRGLTAATVGGLRRDRERHAAGKWWLNRECDKATMPQGSNGQG